MNKTENTHIINWIKENFDGLYTIEFTENNEIIIHGDITLNNHTLPELKYPFYEIFGNFSIGGDKFGQYYAAQYSITTLKNCPKIIHGDFNCALCPKLQSLEGGPTIVEGIYACHNSDLLSLNGIAHTVKKEIKAYANRNLIDIEALSEEGCTFGYIDLDICSDFLYGSPLYKELLKEYKTGNY